METLRKKTAIWSHFEHKRLPDPEGKLVRKVSKNDVSNLLTQEFLFSRRLQSWQRQLFNPCENSNSEFSKSLFLESSNSMLERFYDCRATKKIILDSLKKLYLRWLFNNYPLFKLFIVTFLAWTYNLKRQVDNQAKKAHAFLGFSIKKTILNNSHNLHSH